MSKKYDVEKIFRDVQKLYVKKVTGIIDKLQEERRGTVVGSLEFLDLDDKMDYYKMMRIRYQAAHSLNDLRLTFDGALLILADEVNGILDEISPRKSDIVKFNENSDPVIKSKKIREKILEQYEIKSQMEPNYDDPEYVKQMSEKYDLKKIFDDVKVLLSNEEMENSVFFAGEIDRMRKEELSELGEFLSHAESERDSLLERKSKLVREKSPASVVESILTKEEAIKAEFHGLRKWKMLRLNRKEYDGIVNRLPSVFKEIDRLERELEIASNRVEDQIRSLGLHEKLALSKSKLARIKFATSLEDLEMTLNDALKLLDRYTLPLEENNVSSSRVVSREKMLEQYLIQPNTHESGKKLSTFNNPLQQNDQNKNTDTGHQIS